MAPYPCILIIMLARRKCQAVCSEPGKFYEFFRAPSVKDTAEKSPEAGRELHGAPHSRSSPPPAQEESGHFQLRVLKNETIIM